LKRAVADLLRRVANRISPPPRIAAHLLREPVNIAQLMADCAAEEDF
jgi:hypothetical protein